MPAASSRVIVPIAEKHALERGGGRTEGVTRKVGRRFEYAPEASNPSC